MFVCPSTSCSCSQLLQCVNDAKVGVYMAISTCSCDLNATMGSSLLNAQFSFRGLCNGLHSNSSMNLLEEIEEKTIKNRLNFEEEKQQEGMMHCLTCTHVYHICCQQSFQT